VFAACAPTPPPTPARPLVVYVDSSISNVARDIRTAFLQAHPELEIELVFEQAEVPLDLILTGDMKIFETLRQENRLQDSPRVVARDPLVVFVARANPKQIERIEDLNHRDLRMAIAKETTPLGKLTRALVENLRGDAAFGPEFPEIFFQNVSAQTDDGANVLEQVIQKQADGGIVYASEADLRREQIIALEITTGLNVSTEYSIAILKSTPDAARAQLFFDFLFSPQAQTLWRDYGYVSPR